MGIISSGFRGRRNKDQPGLPPGQYLTESFPVLSAGPTPRITTAEWEFSSYGGYTTNLPMEDILGGKAWVVHQFDGDDLAPAHGGPARLLVPHLYFWKSAKWVRGVSMMQRNDPGFWESNGYNLHADPWLEERYW
jgi:DMSO/TMAO reductase YedYZ molybdopterin-dependent catalytic subunit